MADTEIVPPPPAAPARPSRPPQHVAVQIVDQLGDIAGTVCVTYLCIAGRVTGIEALVAICSLLGALQGLRIFTARFGGGVGGAASLLVLLGGAALAALRTVPGASVGALLAGLALGAAGCTDAQLAQLAEASHKMLLLSARCVATQAPGVLLGDGGALVPSSGGYPRDDAGAAGQ